MQGQPWLPRAFLCPWHSPVSLGSALHTLSFRLRSAPRSCSSLTASRCPPRQAQCTAVQSSCVHKAASLQGTPPPHVHSPSQLVPVPSLSRQSPAGGHLSSGDSTASLQEPQHCCCSSCAMPRGSGWHGAGGRIWPHPVPEVDGGPTVQQLLQDVHVSLQRGAVQGRAVELGDEAPCWWPDPFPLPSLAVSCPARAIQHQRAEAGGGQHTAVGDSTSSHVSGGPPSARNFSMMCILPWTAARRKVSGSTGPSWWWDRLRAGASQGCRRGDDTGVPCPASPGSSPAGRVTQGLARGGSSLCPSSPPPAPQDPLTYNLQRLRWCGGLGGGRPFLPALPALLAELNEALDAPHINDLPPQVHRALPHPLLALRGTCSTPFAFSVSSQPPRPPCAPTPPHLDSLKTPIPGTTVFLLLQLRRAHPLHGQRLPCAIPFESLHGHGGAASSQLGTEQPHHLCPQPTGSGGSGDSSQLTAEVCEMPNSPWACTCPPALFGKLGTCLLLSSASGKSSWVGNLMPLRALGHLAASPRIAGLVPASSHLSP